MTARKREAEDSRQLARWDSLIEWAVRAANPSVLNAVGGPDDARQVATMAVIKALRSPRFADVQKQRTYLRRAVMAGLIDAASDSSLIRVYHERLRLVARGEKAGRDDKLAEATRRALRLEVVADVEQLGFPDNESERGPEASLAAKNVAWAISRLPPTIAKIMGHTYGVAGYDKLDSDAIALQLRLKPETVRRHAYEGRRLLRSLLKDCGYTEADNGKKRNKRRGTGFPGGSESGDGGQAE